MGKSRLRQLFFRFADIKPGEGPLVFLLFTFFFLITAPHTIIKALRYTNLLRSVGTQGLPLAYILAAVTTGLVVVVLSKVQLRISSRLMINSSLVFFIVTGLLLQIFLETGNSALSYIYWIWASIMVVVLMTYFGLTITEVFNPREARRLIGVCGSGGILGGMLGGFAAKFLTELNFGNLLLPFACFLLFLCIFVVNAIFASQKPTSQAAPDKKAAPVRESVGFKESFQIVRGNRYLMLLGAIVITTGIISTFIDFQFSSKVEEVYRRTNEMQAFFGMFFGVLTTVAFFLQLLMTRNVLKNFGIRFTLLLAPAVLMFGSLGVIAGGLTLPLMIIVKGSDDGLNFSLNQSVKEILYIPLELDLRYKVRPFIDMFLNRIAKVVAAILLFAGGFIAERLGTIEEIPYASPIKDIAFTEHLAYGVVALTLVWIILILKVHKAYISAIIRNIPRQWIPGDQVVAEQVDVDYAKMVFDTLDSRNRSSVLFAMHLFDLLEHDKLTPDVKQMIYQKVDEVKVSSLPDLFNAQGVSWFPDIDDDLSQEGLIKDIKEIISLESYQQLMGAHADNVMKKGQDAEVDKMELAKAIGLMEPDAALVQKLDALIRDESPEVSRYAIESAGRLGQKEHIVSIISKLHSPYTRDDAVSALKRYGDTALSALEKRLRDSKAELALRSAVVSVLANIGSQDAFDVLSDELEGKPEELESLIIGALDRIRSEHAGIHVHEKVVMRKMQDLIRRHCRSFIALQELEPGEDHEAERKSLQRRADNTIMNVFKLMGLYYPREDISKAYQNLKTGTKNSHAFAIELLDNTLKKDLRDIILPMVEDISPELRVRRFRHILRNL